MPEERFVRSPASWSLPSRSPRAAVTAETGEVSLAAVTEPPPDYFARRTAACVEATQELLGIVAEMSELFFLTCFPPHVARRYGPLAGRQAAIVERLAAELAEVEPPS